MSAHAAMPLPNPRPSSSLSPWIMGKWTDITFNMLLPVLLVGLGLSVHAFGGLAGFSMIVAISAVGHHVPTMFRIYSDRRMVARFPLRFLLLPLLLLVVGGLEARLQTGALSLLMVAWAPWHGAMQTFGIMRIYDAKSGKTDANTSKLDLALCLTVLFGATLMSDNRLMEMLASAYKCGLPALPHHFVLGARIVWGCIAVIVGSLYARHLIRNSKQLSVLKLTFMLISFLFFWVCMNLAPNPIIGVALIELAHDLQYDAVGWSAGERRWRGVGGVPLGAAVFKRNWLSLALFVAAVAGYGALSVFGKTPNLGTAASYCAMFFVVSTLLHFYFDGFIWKLRDPVTRSDLGISHQLGVVTAPQPKSHWPYWAVAIASVMALSVFQTQNRVRPVTISGHVALSFPNNARAREAFGGSLLESGAAVQAYGEFVAAQSLQPDLAGIDMELSKAATAAGDYLKASEHVRRHLSHHPDDYWALIHLGVLEGRSGRQVDALTRFEQASSLRPEAPDAFYLAGQTYGMLGDHAHALVALTKAVAIAPRWDEAVFSMNAARQAVLAATR